MIDKWNALSQNNKIALIVVILSALFAVLGYLGNRWLEPPPTEPAPISKVEQKTTGDNSPAISGTKGDVTTSGDNSPAITDTKGDVTITINRAEPEEQ